MIIGYTKLFSKILQSSIWNEDDKTRIVWFTLLAMSDSNGKIESNPASLARIANVDLAACEAALKKFLSPDLHSSTPDKEGRRIEVVEGGWRLINHAKYKAMMSQEHRAAYKAAKAREYRLQAKAAKQGMTIKEIVKEKVDAIEKLEGGK